MALSLSFLGGDLSRASSVMLKSPSMKSGFLRCHLCLADSRFSQKGLWSVLWLGAHTFISRVSSWLFHFIFKAITLLFTNSKTSRFCVYNSSLLMAKATPTVDLGLISDCELCIDSLFLKRWLTTFSDCSSRCISWRARITILSLFIVALICDHFSKLMLLSLPMCAPFMLRVAILMLALFLWPFFVWPCGGVGMFILVLMCGFSWLGGQSVGPLLIALVFHIGLILWLVPGSLIWCALGLQGQRVLLYGWGVCNGILGGQGGGLFVRGDF